MRLHKTSLRLLVALLYAFTQVVCANAAETSFWTERRSRLKNAKEPSRLAMAAAPSVAAPMTALLKDAPPVSAVLSAKSGVASPGRERADFRGLLAAVPSTLATVQQVSDANGAEPPVLIIQDVHLMPEAQKNIGDLIVMLSEKAGVSWVGVEGAFKPLDFTPFAFSRDGALRRAVADSYLKANRLAAPSWAGIVLGDRAPIMAGVDDANSYAANVNAYLDARATQAALKARIAQLERALGAAKSRHLAGELARYADLRHAYESGKAGLGAYVNRLLQIAPATPMLRRFAEAHRLEAGLDFPRVERERRAALEMLAARLSQASLERLLNLGLEHRAGKLSFGAFYRELSAMCAAHGIDMARTPAFEQYVRYVLLADGIQAEPLMDELHAAEQEAERRLVRTDEERRTLAAGRAITLLSRISDFALTPDDWEAYRAIDPSPYAVAADLAALGAPAADGAAPDLGPFEAFYVEADRRSEAMLGHLLEKGRTGPRALVVGGFHSPQLAAALTRARVPFAVVTPRITKIDAAEATAYLSVFAREKTPLDRLFRGERLSINPTVVNVNEPATAVRTAASLGARESGRRTVPVELPGGRVSVNVAITDPADAARDEVTPTLATRFVVTWRSWASDGFALPVIETGLLQALLAWGLPFIFAGTTLVGPLWLLVVPIGGAVLMFANVLRDGFSGRLLLRTTLRDAAVFFGLGAMFSLPFAAAPVWLAVLLAGVIFAAAHLLRDWLTGNFAQRRALRDGVILFVLGVLFTLPMAIAPFDPTAMLISAGLHIGYNAMVLTARTYAARFPLAARIAEFFPLASLSADRNSSRAADLVRQALPQFKAKMDLKRSDGRVQEDMADAIIAALRRKRQPIADEAAFRAALLDEIASQMALSEPIPVVELVTAMQGRTAADAAKAVQQGGDELDGLLGRVDPDAADVTGRKIRNLSFNQFPDSVDRPVVEIILNGIDAQERLLRTRDEEGEKTIDVDIRDGALLVRDRGEGIMPQDLAKLLNPGEGGNVGQETTAGRFGAGFLSTFVYLAGEGDSLVIRSVRGGVGHRYEFRLVGGRLHLHQAALAPSEIERIGQGTEIQIRSPLVNEKSILAQMRSALRDKRDARLNVRGSRGPVAVNPQGDVRMIADDAESGASLRVSDSEPVTGPGERSEIVVAINGVRFQAITVETSGQPRHVVIDFKKNLFAYDRSRSQAFPTQEALAALEGLVSNILSRYQDDPVTLLRTLDLIYPLVLDIQQRTPPPAKGAERHSPVDRIKGAVASLSTSGYLPGFPIILTSDAEVQAAVAGTGKPVVFLHKDLAALTEKFPVAASALHRDHPAVRFVSLRDGVSAVMTAEGLLLVDPSLAAAMNNPGTRDEVLATLQAVADVSAYVRGNGAKIKTPLVSAVRRDTGSSVPVRTGGSGDFGLKRQQGESALLARVRQARTREEFYAMDRVLRAVFSRMYGTEVLFEQFVPDVFWADPTAYFSFDSDGAPSLRLPVRPDLNRKYQQATGFASRLVPASLSDLLEAHPAEEDRLYIMALHVHAELQSMSTAVNYPGQIYNPADSRLDWLYQEVRKKYGSYSTSVYSMQNAFEIYLTRRLGLKMIDPVEVTWSRNGVRAADSVDNAHFIRVTRDMEPYVRTTFWVSVYNQLLFAYFSASDVDPKDTGSLHRLVRRFDAMFVDMFAGKSEADVRAMMREFDAMHPSALDLGDTSHAHFDLDDIRKAMAQNGVVSHRLLAHLHRMFGDTPLSDAAPEGAIPNFSGGARFRLSQLLRGLGQNRDSAEQVRGARSMAALAKALPAFEDGEITKRQQAAIRSAAEQTADPFAFLREIVTNAYEALRALAGAAVPAFQVRAWAAGESLVVSMSDDGIGMDMQTILTQLLRPGASGWKSDWLHFGQGFFSIFQSSKEVRLRTTRGGVTTFVSLVPVREGGQVVDIDIRMGQLNTGEKNGTTIEWHRPTPNPVLSAAEVWAALSSYVGLFDPKRMRIVWNSTLVNTSARTLSRLRSPSGDESISFVLSPGQDGFSLNQFFMRRLSDDMTATVPPLIMSALKRAGLVINLDWADAQPLEGRTDFVGRAEKLRKLGPLMFIGSVRAAARLMAEQGDSVLMAELPHDIVDNAVRYIPQPGSEVHDDLERVLSGRMPRDIGVYGEGPQARGRTALLVASIPMIELAGEKVSLLEALARAAVDKGLRSQLPAWVQEAIKKKEGEKKIVQAESAGMASRVGLAKEAKVDINPSDPRAALLMRWWKLAQTVLQAVHAARGDTPGYRQLFFSSSDANAIARTDGKTVIEWNILAIYQELLTLHAVLASAHRGAADPSLTDALVRSMFLMLIDTATHELAHILRGEKEEQVTHTPEFFRFQLVLINQFLAGYRNGGSGSALQGLLRGPEAVDYTPTSATFPAAFTAPAGRPRNLFRFSLTLERTRQRAADWMTSPVPGPIGRLVNRIFNRGVPFTREQVAQGGLAVRIVTGLYAAVAEVLAAAFNPLFVFRHDNANLGQMAVRALGHAAILAATWSLFIAIGLNADWAGQPVLTVMYMLLAFVGGLAANVAVHASYNMFMAFVNGPQLTTGPPSDQPLAERVARTEAAVLDRILETYNRSPYFTGIWGGPVALPATLRPGAFVTNATDEASAREAWWDAAAPWWAELMQAAQRQQYASNNSVSAADVRYATGALIQPGWAPGEISGYFSARSSGAPVETRVTNTDTLEIGVGYGGLAAALILAGARSVTATDYDPAVLALAQRNLPGVRERYPFGGRQTELRFLSTDASRLEGVADASIDHAFLSQVGIYVLPALRDRMLRRIFATLRPGGTLGIIDYLDGPPSTEDGGDRWTPDQWLAALRAAGFEAEADVIMVGDRQRLRVFGIKTDAASKVRDASLGTLTMPATRAAAFGWIGNPARGPLKRVLEVLLNFGRPFTPAQMAAGGVRIEIVVGLYAAVSETLRAAVDPLFVFRHDNNSVGQMVFRAMGHAAILAATWGLFILTGFSVDWAGAPAMSAVLLALAAVAGVAGNIVTHASINAVVVFYRALFGARGAGAARNGVNSVEARRAAVVELFSRATRGAPLSAGERARLLSLLLPAANEPIGVANAFNAPTAARLMGRLPTASRDELADMIPLLLQIQSSPMPVAPLAGALSAARTTPDPQANIRVLAPGADIEREVTLARSEKRPQDRAILVVSGATPAQIDELNRRYAGSDVAFRANDVSLVFDAVALREATGLPSIGTVNVVMSRRASLADGALRSLQELERAGSVRVAVFLLVDEALRTALPARLADLATMIQLHRIIATQA